VQISVDSVHTFNRVLVWTGGPDLALSKHAEVVLAFQGPHKWTIASKFDIHVRVGKIVSFRMSPHKKGTLETKKIAPYQATTTHHTSTRFNKLALSSK
jgi:hypothetical protein